MSPHVSPCATFTAMAPDHRPAERQAIDLVPVESVFRDNEEAYWTLRVKNLGRRYDPDIRGRVETQEIRDLSDFALAPQPLLGASRNWLLALNIL